MNTQVALDALARVLAPYLGETMARASLRAHCERLGIGAEMTPTERQALIEKVGHGMNIFVGREKTAAIMQEMVRAAEEQPT